jgi:hypothetical protein
MVDGVPSFWTSTFQSNVLRLFVIGSPAAASALYRLKKLTTLQKLSTVCVRVLDVRKMMSDTGELVELAGIKSSNVYW